MSGSYRVVGKPSVRIDALDKVLGRLRFAADVKLPGFLHLRVVRSTEAHARVLAIHQDAALSIPGVVRVFTAADVPGENRFGIIRATADQPMLAIDRVRFVGDAVALVAAETPEAAAAGARALRVHYAPLPVCNSAPEALAEGAPKLHERDNTYFEQKVLRGDVDAAFSNAHAIVARTYRTSRVEHAYLEPEAGFAHLDGDVVVVTASTQNPHYDRDDLCRLLALPHERLRVVQAPTGGGFGGKLDLSVQPYVALCTLLTGRPSRLVYSREESFLASGKRHPYTMTYRTAVDREGSLLAVEADLLADSGAYASYGFAVAMRAAVHAAGPYRIPNARIRSRVVYTNQPFCGAMRGFGTPQVEFASESQMDLLAAELGISPLEIRLRNALRPGDQTITGQTLGDGVALVECLERVGRVGERWRGRLRSDRQTLRGMGFGAMYYGIGNTGVSNPSTAQVELGRDGVPVLHTGAADMGQGSDQTLLTLCAEVLGTTPEAVRLVRGDTHRTTNAGASSASRQTYISGCAVVEAASRFRDQLLAEAGGALGLPTTDLYLEDGAVRCARDPAAGLSLREVASLASDAGRKLRGEGAFDPETSALDHETGQGHPYATFAFAAQIAQVEVDRATAQVRVSRVAAAHDVGRAICPPGVLGQITGGVAMGVGMALMEEFSPGKDTNLDTYLIPTALDAPRIAPMFVERPEPTGPCGAKGVGEPALIPTAPAVINALADATGTRIDSLPANLERVLEALEKREEQPWRPQRS